MNFKSTAIVIISSLLALSFTAIGQNKTESLKTTVSKAAAAKPDTQATVKKNKGCIPVYPRQFAFSLV